MRILKNLLAKWHEKNQEYYIYQYRKYTILASPSRYGTSDVGGFISHNIKADEYYNKISDENKVLLKLKKDTNNVFI